MIKRDIKYTDYNDIEQTETFYFNFTKLEVAETELELGGIEETMNRLTETSDIKAAYHLFKDLLLSAYGRKTPDGKHFEKEDENGRPLAKQLENSPALGELIIDLMADVNDAAAFFRGMLPKDAQRAAMDADAAVTTSPAQDATVTQLPTAPPVLEKEKSVKDYSKEELLQMDQKLFDHLAGTDPRKMQDLRPDLLAIAYQRKTSQ